MASPIEVITVLAPKLFMRYISALVGKRRQHLPGSFPSKSYNAAFLSLRETSTAGSRRESTWNWTGKRAGNRIGMGRVGGHNRAGKCHNGALGKG